MTPYETAHAWRILEGILARIPDAILRNAFRKELEKRAVEQWGYCPTETETYKQGEKPVLNELQQEIYDRIQTYHLYGVDVKTEEDKRKLRNETLNNMCEFINRGGTYWETPKDIQCDSLKKIYDEAYEIVFSA